MSHMSAFCMSVAVFVGIGTIWQIHEKKDTIVIMISTFLCALNVFVALISI